jgi:hypothetical protein
MMRVLGAWLPFARPYDTLDGLDEILVGRFVNRKTNRIRAGYGINKLKGYPERITTR